MSHILCKDPALTKFINYMPFVSYDIDLENDFNFYSSLKDDACYILFLIWTLWINENPISHKALGTASVSKKLLHDAQTTRATMNRYSRKKNN